MLTKQKTRTSFAKCYEIDVHGSVIQEECHIEK